jgi:hypothetical protein
LPKLVNAKTNALEELPAEQAEGAFLSGSHNLPAGPVPIVDPDGVLGTVDAAEVFPAITRGGYRFPTQGELDDAAGQAKYGTGIVNQAEAAAAGLARGVTAGLSDPALVALGVPKETLAGQKKYNPVTAGLSEAAGVIAPLIATAGAAAPAEAGARAAAELTAPGLLSRAGRAVTGAVGEELGANVAERTAKKILASGAANFAGSALEGAAYTAGHLVSEHALGDPDLTAQQVMAQVGIGALIGGTIGTALGIPSSMKAASPAAADVVQGIQNDVAAARAGGAPDSGELAPNGTLPDALRAMKISDEKKASIVQGLQELKPNAGEIVEAAKTIEAPVIESQLSASKHVQDLDSMLMQSPTVVGVARQQLVQKGLDAAARAVDDSLAASTTMSQAEVGNAIKKGLVEKFEAESEPINQLYSEIKKSFESIPLSEQASGAVARNVMKIEGIALSPSSPEYQLAKSVSEELGNLKTVDDLKSYQSILRRRTAGSPELRFVAGEIQTKLRALEENSIVRFAKEMVVPEPEAKASIADLLQQREAANARYTALREKMSEIGEVIGKKKIYGPQDFLNYLEDVTPEKLSEKLFAKKNSEFLSFFAKEFPEETKLLSDFQRNRIRDAAFFDGKLKPERALREIEKFSPEVKRILFTPEEVKRIEAAQTYLEAMPKNINPSGTSKAEAYRRFFTNPIAASVETAKDAATMHTLRNIVDKTGGADTERFQTLISLERMAQKTGAQIVSGARAIFKASDSAAGYTASKVTSETDHKEDQELAQKKFKKRQKEILAQAQNPEAMGDTLDKATSSLYPHAPQVAGAFQRQAMRAVQYLASKLPQAPEPTPLDEEWEVAPSEVSQFNEVYDAVSKPVSILERVKEGTLSAEEVEAVELVHPELFKKMQAEVMERISAHKGAIPYQTRLMLGLFLGQDLESSTTPAAIVAQQSVFTMPSQKKDAEPLAGKTTQGGLSKLEVAGREKTAAQRSSDRDDT